MSLIPNQSEEQPTIPLENAEDDFEVITSEEVDRILDALDQVIASTTSENIRSCLEEAADNIYSLVYSEDEALNEAPPQSAEQECAEQDEAA